MKRLVLSAILALGVTSGVRGQTVSLDNPSVLNGVGDVLVYLDKCGDRSCRRRRFTLALVSRVPINTYASFRVIRKW